MELFRNFLMKSAKHWKNRLLLLHLVLKGMLILWDKDVSQSSKQFLTESTNIYITGKLMKNINTAKMYETGHNHFTLLQSWMAIYSGQCAMQSPLKPQDDFRKALDSCVWKWFYYNLLLIKCKVNFIQISKHTLLSHMKPCDNQLFLQMNRSKSWEWRTTPQRQMFQSVKDTML